MVSAYTTVSAVGRGCDAAVAALQAGTTGLRPCDFDGVEIDTWIGRVEGLEDEPVTGALAAYDCRNNRLAQLALNQPEFLDALVAARDRYGPRRIGVYMGTSTSGIRQTEEAYARRDPDTGELPADFNYQCTHNMFSCADFVRRALALEGPAVAISTACSSSSKAFASAERAIHAGWCDAAVVGGVDTLCRTTLFGFRALELLSDVPCRPWDVQRRGLSLGEASGLALLTRRQPHDTGIALIGYGETSDAYHMTAPHPEGRGAADAMAEALDRANLTAADVDYVNLHGTGTPANDKAEDMAVVNVLGTDVPCSSTKGWTGHTLGAAGITEAIFSCLILDHDFVPRCINTDTLDPDLSANILLENTDTRIKVVASNSFGFGGTNCSLLFGRIN